MAARPLAERERVVASLDEWREWLAANHARGEGVWVVTWKKGDARHVPYGDVRDEALCWGWIDSRPAKLDDERSMLLVSPRKPRSGWSGVNKARVAALTADGRMRAPGLAAVARAESDGSWVRLDGATALSPPDDLRAAFAEHPGSAAAFAGFPASARRGVLEWIAAAKTATTRARRVAATAEAAARGERANEWRKR